MIHSNSVISLSIIGPLLLGWFITNKDVGETGPSNKEALCADARFNRDNAQKDIYQFLRSKEFNTMTPDQKDEAVNSYYKAKIAYTEWKVYLNNNCD